MPLGSGSGGIQLGTEVANATTDLLIDNGALTLTALGAGQGLVTVQESASGSFAAIRSRSLLLSGAAQQLQVDDGGGTVKTLADQAKLLIGYTAAPADAALSNGQLAFWFDSAPPGALKIKAKDSGGTVRTATIVLV